MMNIHVSTIGKGKDANVGHVPVFNHRDGLSAAEIEPGAEALKFFIHFVVLFFKSRSTGNMTSGVSLGKFPPSRSVFCWT
jgi:hypothetical protein